MSDHLKRGAGHLLRNAAGHLVIECPSACECPCQADQPSAVVSGTANPPAGCACNGTYTFVSRSCGRDGGYWDCRWTWHLSAGGEDYFLLQVQWYGNAMWGGSWYTYLSGPGWADGWDPADDLVCDEAEHITGVEVRARNPVACGGTVTLTFNP